MAKSREDFGFFPPALKQVMAVKVAGWLAFCETDYFKAVEILLSG